MKTTVSIVGWGGVSALGDAPKQVWTAYRDPATAIRKVAGH